MAGHALTKALRKLKPLSDRQGLVSAKTFTDIFAC